jgi:hypothetical protein
MPFSFSMLKRTYSAKLRFFNPPDVEDGVIYLST